MYYLPKKRDTPFPATLLKITLTVTFTFSLVSKRSCGNLADLHRKSNNFDTPDYKKKDKKKKVYFTT